MSATDWGDVDMAELLPTGTVTLLLADVEGSTQLWESQPAVTAAVARLDRTVSELIAEHGGVRPVEQGEGDSFVAAFTRASDAVACALQLQRTDLAPVKLRIGLHTGEVQLPRPMRVAQLCHPALRNGFPPLRTSKAVATQHLPTQLTSFVGRGTQIADLRAILVDNRLVTLTGAGGAGKTRLAISRLQQAGPDLAGTAGPKSGPPQLTAQERSASGVSQRTPSKRLKSLS